MASLTAVVAKHATLSGTTADDITFSPVHGDSVHVARSLRVTNRAAAEDLYFNVNSATTPVAAADNVFYVKAGTSVSLNPGGLVKLVRVVGNGNAYSVEIV